MNTDYHNSNFLNGINDQYMNSYSALVIKSAISSSDTLECRKHVVKRSIRTISATNGSACMMRAGALLLTSKVRSLSCQTLHFAPCKFKFFVRHTRLNDNNHLQEFTESSSSLILSNLIKSLSSL